MKEEQERINRQIVNAVYNIDPEEFLKLVGKHGFDPSLLEDIHIANGIPCPIHWITQCWEHSLDEAANWAEGVQETIAERIEQNMQFKQYFEEQHQVQFKPIDFYHTDFWFHRAEREDEFEDIFTESRDIMLSDYNAIDLDLYIAVCKFDYEEAEFLLESGANPARMIEEETYSCLELAGTECTYLEIQLNSIIMGVRKANIYQDSSYLIELIGLAANKQMYGLLSRYDPRN